MASIHIVYSNGLLECGIAPLLLPDAPLQPIVR
jgi:hypothetical protein